MKGKVLLLTGSTGIAEATATLAGAAGARIFVVSRTPANCRKLAEDLEANSVATGWYPADLSQASAAVAAVRAALAKFGRLDAVFNVAGISGRSRGDGPAHEVTEEGWDATLDANAKSAFLVCREALKAMLAQQPGEHGLRGTILNMSSVLATSPEPVRFATHAYAASKGAINAMSLAMAATYAPHGIRINVIAPGLVRTPMSRRAQENPEIIEAMKTKQPLAGDLIPPERVAKAALFLLGDESAAITGQVLAVDAGWSVGA